MEIKYIDLIEQTFEFPQKEFRVEKGALLFHNISLTHLIKKYSTPLRISYLPKISENIQRAKKWFQQSFEKNNYKGNYIYAYCTKSSHFSFVINKVLESDAHLECSSAYDMEIMRKLYETGKITKDTYIICNGFKRPLYTQYVSDMVNEGFNVIPVLDNMKEIECYERQIKEHANIGIRIASEEAPDFSFYTSRLGIRYSDIVDFYKQTIKDNPKFTLKMLHFFINTGISDSAYYWSELNKCLNVFIELKKICPSLSALNIGGGFPIKSSLAFDYDYEYMVDEIVRHIKEACDTEGFEHPDIFTEFGSFTVGESGAILYKILDRKKQNDRELWYMIDGSFITHLPDIWGIDKKFILLAINQWDKPYIDVNLGGLTCDSMDYYNQESHVKKVFLPEIKNGDDLYIGFFHTGAYQESIGGLGGIQHCLIPAARHLVIDKDEKGNLKEYLFMDEQSSEHMLKTLGY